MTGNIQFMYIESRGQPRLLTLRTNPFRTRSAASHFLPLPTTSLTSSSEERSPFRKNETGWSVNNNKPIKSVVSDIRVVRLCLNAKRYVIRVYRILELSFYVSLWVKRLKPVRRCYCYLLLFKRLA